MENTWFFYQMIPQSVIFTLRKINLYLNRDWTSDFEISCSIALGFLLTCFIIVCLGRIEPTCCCKRNSSWEILPPPTQSLFSPRKYLLCRYLQRTSVNPTATSSEAKARQGADFVHMGLRVSAVSHQWQKVPWVPSLHPPNWRDSGMWHTEEGHTIAPPVPTGIWRGTFLHQGLTPCPGTLWR